MFISLSIFLYAGLLGLLASFLALASCSLPVGPLVLRPLVNLFIAKFSTPFCVALPVLGSIRAALFACNSLFILALVLVDPSLLFLTPSYPYSSDPDLYNLPSSPFLTLGGLFLFGSLTLSNSLFCPLVELLTFLSN